MMLPSFKDIYLKSFILSQQAKAFINFINCIDIEIDGDTSLSLFSRHKDMFLNEFCLLGS